MSFITKFKVGHVATFGALLISMSLVVTVVLAAPISNELTHKLEIDEAIVGSPGDPGTPTEGEIVTPEAPGTGADCTPAPFLDTANHWAEPEICRAAAEGIAEGYPDGTFGPGQSVTRGELVAFFVRALGWDAGGPSLTYGDNDRIADWLRPALERATAEALVEGYDDGTFRPQQAVTRAEAASIVARALGLGSAGDASSEFADHGDIPEWARGYIAALQQTDLVRGRDGNRFAPEARLTRAEAVVLALRMLDWPDAEADAE